MQQVQDRLEFQIETPSDTELSKRFADRQKELNVKPANSQKYKKRCNKSAKKLARLHR